MTLNRKQELLALLKQSKEAINGQSLAEHFGDVKSLFKILPSYVQMVPRLFQLIGAISIKVAMTIVIYVGCLR